MENIKALLLKSLTGMQTSLTGVQSVKSYHNNQKAISDAEKMVYTDAGIALGDYTYERELYGVGYDKIRHKIILLYFIKSQIGYDNFVDNTSYIASQLRSNSFEKNSIINSKVDVSNEWNVLTDRIQYCEMTFTCVEIKEIA